MTEALGQQPLLHQDQMPDYEQGAVVAFSRNPSVEFCKVFLRGHEVPYIAVFKVPIDDNDEQAYIEPDAMSAWPRWRWELILDDRMIWLYPTEEACLEAVKFAADAMAIAAGWTCHGSSHRLNRHGPSPYFPSTSGMPS